MPTSFIEDSTLTAIADAIREKNGSSDTYTPLQMVTAIQDIRQSGEPDYLHFIANKSGASINIVGRVNSEYTGDLLDIEYSTDKVNWTALGFTTSEGTSVSDTITFTNAGDTVYFRGDNPYGFAKGDFISGSGDYTYAFGSISGTPDTNEFSVHGDLSTIKDKTGENKDGGSYPFLFCGVNMQPNFRITSAPYLPSTLLSEAMYYGAFACQDKLSEPARMPSFELSDLPLSEYGAFMAMYGMCPALSNSAIFQKLALPSDPTQDDIMKFVYNIQMVFYMSGCTITDDNGLTLRPFPLIQFPISFMGESMSSFYCAKQFIGNINGFECVTIHGYCNESNAFGNINTTPDDIDYGSIYNDGNTVAWWVASGGITIKFIANPQGNYEFVKWQTSNDEGTTWTDASTSEDNYTVTFNSPGDFYVKMVVQQV